MYPSEVIKDDHAMRGTASVYVPSQVTNGIELGFSTPNGRQDQWGQISTLEGDHTSPRLVPAPQQWE
eukprot:1417244-Prorocentrum_lima.AAC.1